MKLKIIQNNIAGFAFVGILLSILLVLGVGFVGWKVWSEQQKNNEKISNLNENLESANNELSEAESKIEELDNPEKKARDTQRKNDLSIFVALINSYAADHNGSFPSTEPSQFNNEFRGPYVDKLEDFSDPNTQKRYTVIPIANVQTPPGIVLGEIQYQWPGKCNGSEFGDGATERQAAARLLLETGDIYCLDL